MRKLLTIASVAVVLVGLASSSFGATITSGSFSIAGTVFVTNPSVTAPVVTTPGTCPVMEACIFWEDGAGTTDGEVDISSTGLPSGDVPVALAGNDAANIDSLMNPPDIVGTFPAAPFMSFNNASVTTTLMINTIFPGVDSPADCLVASASGQTCTLPGSFVNFENNPPPTPAGTPCGAQCQATATFSFQGVTSGNANPQSTWTGNFTSQFPLGDSYQTILGELATKGYVTNTFSGTISLTPTTVSTVPEPTTMALIGTGAALLWLGKFRRKKS